MTRYCYESGVHNNTVFVVVFYELLSPSILEILRLIQDRGG